MRVVLRPEAAVRSPCYSCRKLGSEEYPDCADTCREMAVYRRQAGLKETTSAEASRGAADDNMETLRRQVRGLQRKGSSYVAIAQEAGISYWVIYSFAKGTSPRISAKDMAKLRQYMEAKHE